MRCLCYFFFSMNRRRPRSTLFPYTTLFRSLKGRVGGRLRGEKAQEVPLRHQRDELAAGREVTEVRERQRAIADLRAELRHLLVGQLQERLKHAELVHELERGGVDRVATEISEKVSVLFEDHGRDTRARQQQPQYHSGRAATGDATTHRLRLPSHASSHSGQRRR